MPKPVNVCIESLDRSTSNDRYMSCVANLGGEPGLGVDQEGQICWQRQRNLSCELWVSRDDRLILRRPPGATSVELQRAGRRLELPPGKPVVVLDQDEFTVGLRRFRLHVHGPADVVVAPALFQPSRHSRSKLTAAALALGVVVATTGCPKKDGSPDKDIEVREHPPEPLPPPPPPTAPLAQAVPVEQAVEAKQKIKELATASLPGMQPDGEPLVGKFVTGAVLMKAVKLEPGKAYGAIGIGLAGVKQLDVVFVPGTPTKLERNNLARDSEAGPTAVVGGGARPLHIDSATPYDAVIHVQVTAGTGLVMVQLFSRQLLKPDGG